MALFKRSSFVFIAVSALFLCSVSTAEEKVFSGIIRASSGTEFLLDTGSSVDPVFVTGYTILEGVSNSRNLSPGDEVKVSGKRLEGNVISAARITLSPEPSLNERKLIDQVEFEMTLREKGPSNVVVVDCRSSDSFNKGHLKDAVPLGSPAGKAGVKDKVRTVVFVDAYRYNREALQKFQERMAAGLSDTLVLAGGVEGWNRSGRPLWTELAAVPVPLPPPFETCLIDVRTTEEYSAGHVAGAFSLPLDMMKWQNFSRLAGMPRLVFYGSDGADDRPVNAALKALQWRMRKSEGVDAPVCVLSGGAAGWKSSGRPLEKGPPKAEFGIDSVLGPEEVSLTEWRSLISSETVFMIDLRRKDSPRPTNSVHIPLEELPARLKDIPKEKEVILFCAIGERARVGQQIMKQNGLRSRYLSQEPDF